MTSCEVENCKTCSVDLDPRLSANAYLHDLNPCWDPRQEIESRISHHAWGPELNVRFSRCLKTNIKEQLKDSSCVDLLLFGLHIP